MSDKEYFQGRSVDDRPLTVIPLLFWISLLVAVLLLFGCSSTSQPPAQKPHLMVCYMKLLGQTEEGYTVASQYCVTAEEFAASQK